MKMDCLTQNLFSYFHALLVAGAKNIVKLMLV